MAPYFVLLGAPIIFSLFYNLKSENAIEEKTGNKIKNYNILIFFFIFFLLLALRATQIGIDTFVYKEYFYKTNTISWSDCLNDEEIEAGYLLFSKLIYVISGGNFQVFLGVVALVCCLPIAILYYRESENGIITILLFLTTTSINLIFFSGLRQAIAVSFAAYAFYFVKSKKPIAFLIVVFFAALFHRSALIMILMYPAYFIKLKPIHLVPIAPLLVVVYLLRSTIFNKILPFLGEKYAERYSATEDTGATTLILLFILFVVFSFLIPDQEKIDEETNGTRNFLLLSLFFQLFTSISYVAMRFNYYYLLFLPIVIPKVINRWQGDDKISKIITNIVFIMFFLFYYIYKMFEGSDLLSIYPYSFFWQ